MSLTQVREAEATRVLAAVWVCALVAPGRVGVSEAPIIPQWYDKAQSPRLL